MRPLHLVPLVLATALLVAGCGGSGPSPGVANVSHAASTTGSSSSAPADPGGGAAGSGGEALDGSSGGAGGGGGRSQLTLAISGSGSDLLKFAQCMRANGEPNFPDPNGQGMIQFSSSSGVNPQSPQFQAAQQRCAKYAPRGGKTLTPAQRAQFLAKSFAFSACMRSHGVPDFPDPSVSGGAAGFHIRGTPGGALDPSSPIFQRAAKDCAADLPGKAGGLPAIAKGAA